MKISHRLLILSTACAVSLFGVGAAGVYGVKAIQDDLSIMTTRSTPLMTVLLEMQETKERTVSALQLLSHSDSEQERRSLSESVDVEIEAMRALNSKTGELDSLSQSDIAAFEVARNDIIARVTSRLVGVKGFDLAAAEARQSLLAVDQSISSVGEGVQALIEAANNSAAQAQIRTDELVNAQQQAREVQAQLNELSVIAYSSDAVTSKFRIGPLQERLTGTMDSLRRIVAPNVVAERLAAVMPQMDPIESDFLNEKTGLFALRVGMIEEDRKAKKAYRALRKKVGQDIGSAGDSLSQLIDDLAYEILQERQSIQNALSMSSDPSGVTAVSQRLSVGIKEMRVLLEQFMLEQTEEKIQSDLTAVKNKLAVLIKQTDTMKEAFRSLGNNALEELSSRATIELQHTATSVQDVSSNKLKKMNSVTALSGAIGDLRDVAELQRLTGKKKIENTRSQLAAMVKTVDQRANTATSLSISIALVAIVILGGFSLLTTRTIVTRLKSALQIAEAVANGRLEPVKQSHHRDEVAELSNALGRMVSMLDGSVKQIRSATEHVNRGAEAIHIGNTSLSERTDRQTTSVQTTAATMRQIQVSVDKGALAASQANELSDVASGVADRGRSVVREAVDTMQNIESGAKEISKIISVIEGISFQTNLLALNAAVEASRAGELGRGFAVVAVEVRHLAHKSKEAAHQIKEIIDKNVAQVETGSALVHDAGTNMEDVVAKVNEVSALISEISKSSEEQVISITQANTSVGQIEETTQQNSDLSSHSRSAADNLVEQARALEAAVSVFRSVGDGAAVDTSARNATPDSWEGVVVPVISKVA